MTNAKVQIKLILSILALSLSIGCAYFNTYYHAQQFYKNAQDSRKKDPNRTKVNDTEKDLYNKAIEKATKVVKNYPKSRWRDDAIFLMANCYYEMGEYRKAEVKYREIVENYTTAKCVSHCYLMLGRVYLELENFVAAKGVLLRLLEKETKGKRAEEAMFLLGEVRFRSKDFSGASEEYQKLLNLFPRTSLAFKTKFRIAEALFEEKKFLEASKKLENLKDENIGKKEYSPVMLKLGECYEEMGKTKEALSLYQKLVSSTLEQEILRSLSLRIARGYRTLGNSKEALKQFEYVRNTYPKTEEAALAYYEEGIIYQEILRNFDKAKKSYEAARNEFDSEKVSRDALRRATSLGHLEEYRKTASGGSKSDLAKNQFLLGELYLFELSEIDSAIASYQKVVNQYPESEYAPKALYGLGWIQENVKMDSIAAAGIYQELIKKYPDTEYADEGRRRLGLPVPERFPKKLVPSDTTKIDEETSEEKGDETQEVAQGDTLKKIIKELQPSPVSGDTSKKGGSN